MSICMYLFEYFGVFVFLELSHHNYEVTHINYYYITICYNIQTNMNQDKSNPKAQLRKTMLMQLLKKKREKDGDNVLSELSAIPQHEDLILAIKHNKFGGFCLQANELEKAETHFTKALGVVNDKYKLPFSNALMNLGNMYGQKRDYKQAIVYYEKALSASPYNPNNKNIQCPKQSCLAPQKYSTLIFSPKLNDESVYIDAHTNIAVMYIQVDEIDKAFQYCKKSLELQPNNHQSIVNFTDILRQLGRKQQAIKRTWQQIVQYTRKQKPDYKGFQAIKIKSWQKKPYQAPKKISVLCVKWGTRYPPSYVNKLYAGIKRNTTWQFDFYCFTEDPNGLYPEIKVKSLEQGWKKWWGKVTLFKDNGIEGRKFYIDLDMIITGNLDQIFGYSGEFMTLRTGDLACQKNHKDGYNSSVMIWNDNMLVPIYEALKENFQNINKFIVRFDFWLEMTIDNSDYIQVVYPGQLVDFLADAKQKLPQNSRIVCFARKPKPEDYPAEWVKQYWVQ